MNKSLAILFALLTSVALVLSPDEAYAKRLGGGKSFGSRPSYSQPYRPSPDASPGFRSSQAQPNRLPAAQHNQALRENFRSRGGLMGMLGGLALGGLLGAMLFGGGFEHINLFDTLVLGLVVYLLYRWFAARRGATWEPAASGPAAPGGATSSRQYPDGRVDAEVPTGARFETDVLFRGGAGDASVATGRRALPPGFDERGFIGRAKEAFIYLQRAWDEGDLEDIRALTTPTVFDELTRQLGEQTGQRHHTHIASLDAQVLEVSEDGGSDIASVLFEARVQEDGSGVPSDIREVWHFIRDRHSDRPTWYLDGVQQID